MSKSNKKVVGSVPHCLSHILAILSWYNVQREYCTSLTRGVAGRTMPGLLCSTAQNPVPLIRTRYFLISLGLDRSKKKEVEFDLT